MMYLRAFDPPFGITGERKPMRLAITVAGLTLATALGSVRSLAQETSNICREIFRTPAVGDYAELHFSSARSDDLDIRFAVVGSEDVNGQPHYRMEIVLSRPGSQEQMITQLLVPSYPFDVKDVKDYVLKLPDQPATRMPQPMIQRMASSGATEMAWEQACAEAQDLGTAEITVAAGTFTARHFLTTDERGQQGEAWLSAEIPFAVVRMEHPDGSMELTRYGSGATAQLTEKPIELRMPTSPTDSAR